MRHDLAPLTKRFDALGTPVAATWLSGTLGGDAPGPSTYWIDAVVKARPGKVAGLAERYSAKDQDQRPAVIEDLRESVPDGPLLTSDALNDAFAQGEFRAKVYLSAKTDQIVLVALGQ